MDHLKSKIRNIPDFPKAGILFYDITTLLGDPDGFRDAIDSLASPFEGRGIDMVVGIESRGFIFGSAVADRLGGQQVLIVDDLLATGGTARATTDLVTRLGGHVAALAFLIELVGLNGRERLVGQNIHTVLRY